MEKTNMTNVKEKKEETIYANMNQKISDEIKEKLKNAKTQHPQWRGQNIDDSLVGEVAEILDFPNLNDGRGSMLMNLRTDDENYPEVAFWLNTVAQSQCFNIVGKPINETHEEKAKTLKQMEGKLIAIRYNGEKKSSKRGYKPYQDYTIIEV